MKYDREIRDNKINNSLLLAFKVFILILGMVILGYVLLFLVYSIESNRMETNLRLSVSAFDTEGYYYSPATINLDNYTDALKLMIASNNSNESPFVSALRGTYLVCTNKDITPAERLVDYYTERENDYTYQDYPRYWHGYQVLLRPLLLFCTYTQLRSLIAMLQLGLFSTIVLLTTKKRMCGIAVAMFAYWIFSNPIATMSSLQFNPVFVITELGVIGVLLIDSKWSSNDNKWVYFFVILGGLTSYFDFLTYPLVTLGLPLITWIYCFRRTYIFDTILKSVQWCLGYAGMWFGKWILASLILHENVIEDGVNQIAFRTGNTAFEGSDMSYVNILRHQIGYGMQYPCLIIFLIVTIFVLYIIIREVYSYLVSYKSGNNIGDTFKNSFLDNNKYIIDVLFIMCYPFAWYFVTKNHSYIHDWMTYRTLGITLFGMIVLCSFYYEYKMNNHKRI